MTTAHAKPNYYVIFAALVAATALTVLASLHRFESEFVIILVALTIASIKAALVALFFMHLRWEGRLIYVIVLVPLLLSLILVTTLLPDVSFAPLFHG